MGRKSGAKKAYVKELEAYEHIQNAVKLEADGDFGSAVDQLRRAARLQSTYAQTTLATMLDDKVNPARREEAVYWYKRAVRAGDASAAWDLAMHYANLGRRRWYLYWLHVAAKMGEPDAQREIEDGKWWSRLSDGV
jgi:TPR repeat protein